MKSRSSRRLRELVVAWAVAILATSPLAAQQQEHEGAEFQLRRLAWFDDQRAYPNAEVNWDAMLRARRSVTERRGFMGVPSIASAVIGSWIPIGPSGFFGVGYWDSGAQLDAGRVDAIALHPTNAGTMFIASPNGGIWGTTTGGSSWAPLTDTQCSLQMSTIAIDPINPSLVYAASAYASGVAGCGILRSTDGGTSWSSYNGSLNFTAYGGSGFIKTFFIDPQSAGTTTGTTMLFTRASFGIYRSTNSGANWSQVLSYGQVNSIVAMPGATGVLFAGVADYATTTSSRSGLYRSQDNGLSWMQVSSGTVDFTSAGRLQLAVSAARPNTVWVISATKNSNFSTISRFDNTSGTLTALTAAGIDLTSGGRTHFGSQGTYDLDIKVDPTNANRIYIAGVRAFRSTDGGATFAAMGTEIHCDWHTIVIDPNNPLQLYAGTDGGIFTSTDGGSSWMSRNNGLAISMYYPGISQHPTDPSIILGGLQDNGSILSNGTTLFNSVSGGDGGYSAINFLTPTTSWSTCQWSSAGGPCIYRRAANNSGGFSYTYPGSGISNSDRAQFIPPLVMDPVTPTTLYFGTMKLYRTTNDGGTFTAISTDLSKGTGNIKTIAIAPSDALTIYVGTSDGNVQVSRDGGTTFTISNAGLPNRTVTRIAVDRANPLRALLTMSGQGASHVFFTTNAGQSWVDISGALPDMPVNAGVIIESGSSHFFIGADVGVFETTDGGLTWTISPSGLPNAVVNDLSYNPTTKQLVAATFGRGLWSFSLANAAAVLRGDVNKDGKVDAFDALLMQQALVGTQLPPGQTAMPNGDTNCNGRLETNDVLITLRAAVGLTTVGACVGTVR
jgi:photosystem II stability/assembly factor-like uncharacterized protein